MAPPTTTINLMRGWPAPSLLPASRIAAASTRILCDESQSTPLLQYGHPNGHPVLRSSLAAWFGRHYRVSPDPDRICITGGASQNLANVLQSYTEPVCTRAVWMAAPCYFLACAIFDDSGFRGRLRAVPEDAEGVDLEALEHKLSEFERCDGRRGEDDRPFKDPGPYRRFYRHVLYTVTTCSNPSGKTMSLPRREALVRLARKYDILVISDDVYDFLQWPTGSEPPSPERPPEMRLPRLCDIDRQMAGAPSHGFGNAVSNGSFSKLAGPGVRTGWMEGTKAFVDGLSHTGSTISGGAPSQLAAGIMGELLSSGELEKFIENKTRPALQRRYQLMMNAIRKHIMPLGFQVRDSSLPGADIYGGYFVWFTLHSGLSSKLVSEVAKTEENLIIGHGSLFEVHGDEQSAQFDQEVRLCFSWEEEEAVVDGVERLGRVLKMMLNKKTHFDNQAGSPSIGCFVDRYK